MFYNPLPILLIPVGLYFLWRLRFFYILHPVKSFSSVLGELRKPENRRSFFLALAGTLGVGNLVGVAIGIIIGGRGSLFWLLISAIPSSVIKYAEVVSCSSPDGIAVNMSMLVSSELGRAGKPLSKLYSLVCLFLSLVMGACLQTRTLIDSLTIPFQLDERFVSVLVLILVLLSIYRGADFVSKITAICIPLTTTMYIVMSIAVIFVHFDRLPVVISDIISGAFSPHAAAGGIIAALLSDAMREGFSRGMLSNEAGAGTSTLAHATGGKMHPAKRGLFGVIEVYFDTVFLCMLSGLAILLSVPDPSRFESGMELLISSFTGSLGACAALPLSISVVAFAYSTVVCWYYYGATSIRDLLGCRCRVFCVVYLLFVLLGGLVQSDVLVTISDALFLILASITLPTIIKSSDRVISLSEQIGFIRVSRNLNKRSGQ